MPRRAGHPPSKPRPQRPSKRPRPRSTAGRGERAAWRSPELRLWSAVVAQQIDDAATALKALERGRLVPSQREALARGQQAAAWLLTPSAGRELILADVLGVEPGWLTAMLRKRFGADLDALAAMSPAQLRAAASGLLPPEPRRRPRRPAAPVPRPAAAAPARATPR